MDDVAEAIGTFFAAIAAAAVVAALGVILVAVALAPYIALVACVWLIVRGCGGSP